MNKFKNKVKECTNVGIKVHGELINMIFFADDIAIMTENETNLKNIMVRMEEIVGNE